MTIIRIKAMAIRTTTKYTDTASFVAARGGYGSHLDMMIVLIVLAHAIRLRSAEKRLISILTGKRDEQTGIR